MSDKNISGKKKASSWPVVLILGIPVLLFFVGGIGMQAGIEYTGASDYSCSRVAGTTNCGDSNATATRLLVLATGAAKHAIVRSEPAVWTARVAFGLVVVGFATWIVLGVVQGIGGRARDRRYRRKQRKPHLP